MPTKEEREAHKRISYGVRTLDAKVDVIGKQQAAQLAAQTPIAMLQGIQPPYFYGDEGEDVEAFIYALVNCASANDWKDSKTVNNLAHFLDGRAGYAFRAAVQHRVDRALGSHKEALLTRRESKEKLARLQAECDEASTLLLDLGEKIGVLSSVKDEEGEEGELKAEPKESKQLQQLRDDYKAATLMFSKASVEQAQAASEVEKLSVLPEVGLKVEGEMNQHTIAFPTLQSALTWLRNTFRREDVEDQLTGDYFGRRQRPGETVQDFALDLLKLHSRAGLVSSEEKQTTHFIEGLRPRFKRTLKYYLQTKKITTTVKDWEGMVKAAGMLEREHPGLKGDDDHTAPSPNFNAIRDSQPEPTQAEERNTYHSPQRTYQFEELAAIVEAVTSAMKRPEDERAGREHNNSNRSKQCYNCHELGHLSWDCPSAPTAQTKEYRAKRGNMPRYSPTCFKCNKVGHYSNACTNGAAAAGGGQRTHEQGAHRTQDPRKQPARQGRQNTSRGATHQSNRRSGNDDRA